MTEREKFEAAISRSPFELSVERWPDDPVKHAWPGSYKFGGVALAWEMWQEAIRQNMCNWTEDSDGTWNTSCGVMWQFSDGGPAENNARFCHHCGGHLAALPFSDDDA